MKNSIHLLQMYSLSVCLVTIFLLCFNFSARCQQKGNVEATKIILYDSTGDKRFILDANTGAFQMLADDTLWYSRTVASPTRTISFIGNGGLIITEIKKDPLGRKRKYERTFLPNKQGGTYKSHEICQTLDTPGVDIITRHWNIDGCKYLEKQKETVYYPISKTIDICDITTYFTCPDGLKKTSVVEKAFTTVITTYDSTHQGPQGVRQKTLLKDVGSSGLKEVEVDKINLIRTERYIDSTVTWRWGNTLDTAIRSVHYPRNGKKIEALSFFDTTSMEFKSIIKTTCPKEGKVTTKFPDGRTRTVQNGMLIIETELWSYWENLNDTVLGTFYHKDGGDTMFQLINPGLNEWQHGGTGVYEGLRIEKFDCPGGTWMEQGSSNDCQSYSYNWSLGQHKLDLDIKPSSHSFDFGGNIIAPSINLLDTNATPHLFRIVPENAGWNMQLYNQMADTTIIHMYPGEVLINKPLCVDGDIKASKGTLEEIIIPGGFGDTLTFSSLGLSLYAGFGNPVGFALDPFSEMVAVNGSLLTTGILGGNAIFDTVHVNHISKSAGSFKIDHPQDPYNKYLYHSFVESPDMMNVYNGNITTNQEGKAIVQLPDYFEALNKDYRYQLTVMGTFAQAIVAEEINNNSFAIMTDKPNIKVSWQVTGIRDDAYARENRIPVEVDKKEHEKGRLIYQSVAN